jgi:uncharacterized protein (DUF885 family)
MSRRCTPARALCLLPLALLAASCAREAPPPAPPERQPSPLAAPLRAENAEAVKLYRIVETWFDQYLALNPIQASQLGDHRFDDRFGDYASPSWLADSLGIDQEALERLATVNPRQLTDEDLITYEAFKLQRETSVRGYRYPSELLAVHQFGNWATVFAQLASGGGAHPFRTARDYENFLGRMDGFAAWSEQAINNLRAGVTKGVVLPRVVVQRTLPQLEGFARMEDPRETPFWAPLRQFPDAVSAAQRERLEQAWEAKLRTRVLPAYRRLHDYLAQEYLPRARATVSWAELPGGDAWYAYLARYHTGTDLTPDQLHELGRAEVARLRAQLAALQPALGLTGDPRAAFAAMRADTRYQPADPEELLAGYEALRERVESRLPELFLSQPTATFEIRAIEPYRAAAAAAAEYRSPSADGTRPGVFYVNTHDLPSRPTYLMEAVFLHEAVPGHHYQDAIAQETANLPRFRRFGWDTAFGEGWALYAESLGEELGLYQTPSSRFGALTLEIWRAARLVVDTGLHAKDWKRERAVEYLRANTGLGEADVQAEVDRYIAWPGQALAYKVGQLQILDLRRRAQRQLGDRFDLREFHEQVVGSGTLPLAVLEMKVEHWIETRPAPPLSGGAGR